MTPKSNGLVEINGSKPDKMLCPNLQKKMIENKYEYDEWMAILDEAKHGNCRFKNQCDIYNRTIKKHQDGSKTM